MEMGEVMAEDLRIFTENDRGEINDITGLYGLKLTTLDTDIARIDKTGKLIAGKKGTTRIVIKQDAENAAFVFNKEELNYETIIFVTFPDAFETPWALTSIVTLNLDNVIKGISDTAFGPNLNIKRGDFILMLMRMLGFEDNDGSWLPNFDDIAGDSYYYNAIAIAKDLGFIEGTGNNRFNPDSNITRQDMLVILYRILYDLEWITPVANANNLNSFDDGNQISEYAKIPLATFVKDGFIMGSENKLYPLENATRAETAVVLFRTFYDIEED